MLLTACRTPETPTEKPTEKPAETTAETTTEKPAEPPTEKPSETTPAPAAGDVPQAVYTEGNRTLTFLCADRAYAEGETISGEKVTKVWSGEEITAAVTNMVPAWHDASFNKIVFDESFSSARPTCTCLWFTFSEEVSIEGLQYLNTSEVTDMSWMFAGSSFTELDLSTFDTSNVTNMNHMFGECKSLKQLDLSSFDTSKVTDMGHMFFLCDSLSEVDLSRFDTSAVTDMSMMFYECYALTKLDLSSFETTSLMRADRMFEGCQNLTLIYCGDSDAEWTLAGTSDEFDGGMGMFSDTPNLVGLYGDSVIGSPNGGEGIEAAKSAKLGGYFTPKN